MEEHNNKGFTIKDKRTFTSTGDMKEPEAQASADTTAQQPTADQSQKNREEASAPLPEINFSTFVLSLSSSALFHFGELPDPMSNTKQRNLPMAKQTIDILGMLKEKTAGNLSADEEKLLENLLYDLRMRYVHEIKKDKPQT